MQYSAEGDTEGLPCWRTVSSHSTVVPPSETSSRAPSKPEWEMYLRHGWKRSTIMLDSKVQYGQDRQWVVQRGENFHFPIYSIPPLLTTGSPVGSATSELNVQSGHSKEESWFHPPVTIMALSTNICDTMVDEGGFPSYAHSQVVSCSNIEIMAVNLWKAGPRNYEVCEYFNRD